MRYYSTNHQSPKVSFKEAMIKSEAADGGLYMPERLPIVPKAFLNNMAGMSLADTSFVINSMLLGNDLPGATLKKICEETSSVKMPMYEIEPGIYVMELFHGITQTVKDYGASFLTRIIQSLHADTEIPVNVLIATNGFSGAAIARSLHNSANVNVFLLYPRGTSKSHLEIINSLGDNIHAIEVNGTIDQCAQMIAKAFEDPDFEDEFALTSANSANLGYLLPLISIYFYAYAQITKKVEHPGDIYLSIPTGNCGNLLAAYMAKEMGLPAKQLIGACNENACFHSYLTNGAECVSHQSRCTLAYGLDSAKSANLPRFFELCQGHIDTLRRDIVSDVCTDDEIAEAINDVYARTGYLLDPHSAVAYKCLKAKAPAGATGILFATASPGRSMEILRKINKGGLSLPPRLPVNYCCRPEAVIAPSYPALKKYLNYYSQPRSLRNRV